MPNAIIAATRLSWDDHDKWGSAMQVLGACCDLFTVIDAGTGHRIPDSVGYRPGMGLSLRSMLEDADTSGTEYDWRFEDFTTECIADALGFEVIHNGEDDEPDLAAEIADWNAAPERLLTAIKILDRYIDACVAAGLDY